ARILRSEGRVVGADAPVHGTGGDVGLDFLVQLEMVLLGKHIDLCAGRLLPIGDARIKRFILLTADQLGVDGDAIEFSGQILRLSATCQSQNAYAGRKASQQISHQFLPVLSAKAASY